ncbi:MAG: LamG domain-containing protein [Planctomycetes bacterium]|nr:LamG domain-containing protein [Planctomycetota bacterium]MBL7146926.1 LamG domain-containing protein [Phycisphaerae bacterium]
MFRKLTYLVSFVLVLSIGGNASADLLVHWALEEGSGTTVFDTSGNGNDGTFTAEPQWVEGHGGGSALHFDGVDDFVAYSFDETQTFATFSVALWVKADTLGQPNYCSPFSSHFPNTAGFQVDVDGGDPGNYRINPNSGNQFVFGTVTLDWIHLALTTEGTSVNLYYNGNWASSNTLVDTDVVFNQFAIGVNRNRNWWFACTIDDLRVYDHVLSEAEILSAMAGQPWPYAFGPEPADGTLHEATWVNLAWKPGDFAASHDVYLGENFEDVNDGAEGTFQGNQTGTFIVVGFPGFAFPDGLVPGTTYYWRIDEVNDTEPNSPWKGDVWSFSIPPKTAYLPDPADGAESVAVDVELSWTGGFGSKLHTVYFGENFDDVGNAAGGLPQGSATYTPGSLQMAKTYYWRVDEFDAVDTYKGGVWSFTTEGAVGNSDPAQGAVDVTQTPVLTWAPGVFADSHEVYFGTDAEAVKNADTSSPEYKGSGNLGSESYDVGNLEWDTTYYWRIDEANNANADSPWTGPLWSFTTANFLAIEDFESYNDLDEGQAGSNRIYLAWIDGFDNPAINGSVVGNFDPPFAEQTIVHSGNQSMPMAYDNAVGKSEATLTLTSNRDWTENDIDKLVIWYIGDTANAPETMYVVLNGTTGVDNPDANVAQAADWTEWKISLQDFGTNLTNVNTITIGFGNRNNPTAGSSGMMYFDDIRLYPPVP